MVYLEDLSSTKATYLPFPRRFEISGYEWHAVKQFAKHVLKESVGLNGATLQLVMESLHSYHLGGPVNSSIAGSLCERFNAVTKYLHDQNLDKIYISTGEWYHAVVTPNGSVIREKMQDAIYTVDLDKRHPAGFLFAHLPCSNGIEFSSDLDLSYDTIRHLSLFLETCSGFKVY